MIHLFCTVFEKKRKNTLLFLDSNRVKSLPHRQQLFLLKIVLNDQIAKNEKIIYLLMTLFGCFSSLLYVLSLSSTKISQKVSYLFTLIHTLLVIFTKQIFKMSQLLSFSMKQYKPSESLCTDTFYNVLTLY